MSAEAEIEAIVRKAMESWNNEDLRAYMANYWESPDFRWSLKGAWHRGWDSMHKAFDRDYPKGAMGVAKVLEIEVMPLDGGLMAAIYTWEHVLPDEFMSGAATQLFRKIDGRWKIVHEIVARVPVQQARVVQRNDPLPDQPSG